MRKKEVVETDQNSYRYIKVDGKDYRYRTNLKTILFLGIDTTDETKIKDKVMPLI